MLWYSILWVVYRQWILRYSQIFCFFTCLSSSFKKNKTQKKSCLQWIKWLRATTSKLLRARCILCRPHLNLLCLSFHLIHGSSSLTSVKRPGDPLLEGWRLLLFPQPRPHPFPQEVIPNTTQWLLPEPARHTSGLPESPWKKMRGGGQNKQTKILFGSFR